MSKKSCYRCGGSVYVDIDRDEREVRHVEYCFQCSRPQDAAYQTQEAKCPHRNFDKELC